MSTPDWVLRSCSEPETPTCFTCVHAERAMHPLQMHCTRQLIDFHYRASCIDYEANR